MRGDMWHMVGGKHFLKTKTKKNTAKKLKQKITYDIWHETKKNTA